MENLRLFSVNGFLNRDERERAPPINYPPNSSKLPKSEEIEEALPMCLRYALSNIYIYMLPRLPTLGKWRKEGS